MAYKDKKKQKTTKKKWWKRNKTKRIFYGKTSRIRRRLQVIEAYGGKCSCCKEEEYEFLTLDHVGGGGTAERKKLKIVDTSKIYRRAREQEYPKSYRVLCWSCNCSIGNYGYCPHKGRPRGSVYRQYGAGYRKELRKGSSRRRLRSR